MLAKKKSTVLVWGGAVAALMAAAGCTPTVGPGVTFDRAGKVLSENKELTADSDLTANLRGNGNTTSRNTTSFVVKRNNNGGVDVNVAGRSMAFSGSDVVGDTWRKAGPPLQVAGAVDKSTQNAVSASDTDYAQVWQYFWSDQQGQRDEGFAVVGGVTPAAQIPSTGAAVSYTGKAGIVLKTTQNPNNRAVVQYGTTQAKLVNNASTARITANFTNKTVTGSFEGGIGAVTDIAGNPQGQAFQAGNLTLGTAAINAAGEYTAGAVTGTIVINGGNNAVDAGSTYSGQFFGPNAEETAGVLNIDLNNGAVVGVGAFHAKK